MDLASLAVRVSLLCSRISEGNSVRRRTRQGEFDGRLGLTAPSPEADGAESVGSWCSVMPPPPTKRRERPETVRERSHFPSAACAGSRWRTPLRSRCAACRRCSPGPARRSRRPRPNARQPRGLRQCEHGRKQAEGVVEPAKGHESVEVAQLIGRSSFRRNRATRLLDAGRRRGRTSQRPIQREGRPRPGRVRRRLRSKSDRRRRGRRSRE